MSHWQVEYREDIMEYLQPLFPRHRIIAAVARATIESEKLILPEVFVNFERSPDNAETRIADNIDKFFEDKAADNDAEYPKTLRRIVVEDIRDADRLLQNLKDDWY